MKITHLTNECSVFSLQIITDSVAHLTILSMIIKIPFLVSNISYSPFDGLYITQIILYALSKSHYRSDIDTMEGEWFVFQELTLIHSIYNLNYCVNTF